MYPHVGRSRSFRDFVGQESRLFPFVSSGTRNIEMAFRGFPRNLDRSFDFHRMYPLANTWDSPFNVSLFGILGVALTMQLHLLSPETPKPELSKPYLLARSMAEIYLDLTATSLSKFREPGVRDATTPQFLALQPPGPEMPMVSGSLPHVLHKWMVLMSSGL
jgi:hypothetical protein